MATPRKRICKDCNGELALPAIYDSCGELNPRGRFCLECTENAKREAVQEAIASAKSAEAKFRIMYGRWWKHYAIQARSRTTCT